MTKTSALLDSTHRVTYYPDGTGGVLLKVKPGCSGGSRPFIACNRDSILLCGCSVAKLLLAISCPLNNGL